MPNYPRRHKKTSARISKGRSRPGKALAVKDLLGRPGGLLRSAVARAKEQTRWHERLSERLPADLVAHVTGIVAEDDALTVFTESAAWCARLRYALLECEPSLRAEVPGLREIEVRVLPPASSAGRHRDG